MQLQKSLIPNTCLLTSFAMACDTNQTHLFHLVGSDPNHILWPRLPEPQCRRGFHIQELIDAVCCLGYCVTEIQSLPMLGQYGDNKTHLIYSIAVAKQRLLNYLTKTQGVIKLKTHAVAWDSKKIYDPKGMIYPIGNIEGQIESYYIITKITD